MKLWTVCNEPVRSVVIKLSCCLILLFKQNRGLEEGVERQKGHASGLHSVLSTFFLSFFLLFGGVLLPQICEPVWPSGKALGW